MTEMSFSRKPLPLGCKRFSYRELQHATGNFAENAIIGEGGFGRVYRGTLDDGRAVAIKCLDRLGLQVYSWLEPHFCTGAIVVHATEMIRFRFHQEEAKNCLCSCPELLQIIWVCLW